MSTSASPVTPTDRIVLLDVLRGLAIFGILMVNMQIFYRPVSLMLAGYTGSESITGMVSEAFIKMFFEGKFYVLFSMLFGYGFWIFINKKTSDGSSIIPVFRRRVFILLIFGILHVVLLWAGDILVFYALFGFILLLFRRVSDRGLIKWAIWLALIPVLLTAFSTLMVFLAGLDPDAKAAVESSMQGRKDYMQSVIENATAIYSSGSFSEIVSVRLHEYRILLPGIVFFYPLVLAMFLTGVWAARKDLIRNYSLHIPFFRKLFWWGLSVGVPANLIYTYSYFHLRIDNVDIFTVLSTLGHIIGGIFLSLSYVSAIVLLVNRGRLSAFNSYLAPAGRMALTNYLMHSIICTTLFLSYGFGLFNQINPFQGILLTMLIFSLQILYSNWWLKRFSYGPFEWIWRKLTYAKMIRFRKNQY